MAKFSTNEKSCIIVTAFMFFSRQNHISIVLFNTHSGGVMPIEVKLIPGNEELQVKFSELVSEQIVLHQHLRETSDHETNDALEELFNKFNAAEIVLKGAYPDKGVVVVLLQCKRPYSFTVLQKLVEAGPSELLGSSLRMIHNKIIETPVEMTITMSKSLYEERFRESYDIGMNNIVIDFIGSKWFSILILISFFPLQI